MVETRAQKKKREAEAAARNAISNRRGPVTRAQKRRQLEEEEKKKKAKPQYFLVRRRRHFIKRVQRVSETVVKVIMRKKTKDGVNSYTYTTTEYTFDQFYEVWRNGGSVGHAYHVLVKFPHGGSVVRATT